MLVTYAPTFGFTAASTSVVTERSYSRYSRSTSELSETMQPGCSASSTSSIARSWASLA